MKQSGYFLVSLFKSIGLAQIEILFFLETTAFDQLDVDLGIFIYSTRGKSIVIELFFCKGIIVVFLKLNLMLSILF